MAEAKGGCLTYLLWGAAASCLAAYFINIFLLAFAAVDKTLAAQVAILAGIDVLSIGAIAYAGNAHGYVAKRHNPAVKVICGFIALGLLCGHGFGLAWLYGTGAINGVIGFTVWSFLVRPLPDDPPSE
jgi:hypothetical protein